MPSTTRQSELGERTTQPFKQKRASTGVIPEEPRAPFTGSEPQHRYLAQRFVRRRADHELQHSRGTVLQTASATNASVESVRPDHGDPPVDFDAADE